MSKFFRRISSLFDTVISWVAVFTIGSYTILIFLGVITRYVLNLPIMVGVELSRIGFVWSCLLGAAVAYKRGLHIAFTIMVASFPKKVTQVLAIVIDIITLGFLIWVLYRSTYFTIRVSPSVLASTGWSAAVLYFPLPFSITGMIFHCIVFIFDDFDALLNKNVLERGASS